jgi:hypothetical protein
VVARGMGAVCVMGINSWIPSFPLRVEFFSSHYEFKHSVGSARERIGFYILSVNWPRIVGLVFAQSWKLTAIRQYLIQWTEITSVSRFWSRDDTQQFSFAFVHSDNLLKTWSKTFVYVRI